MGRYLVGAGSWLLLRGSGGGSLGRGCSLAGGMGLGPIGSTLGSGRRAGGLGIFGRRVGGCGSRIFGFC